MARKFIYIKKDGSGPSRLVSFADVMNVAENRLVKGEGPFVLLVNGKQEGNERTRVEMLDALGRWVGLGQVGDVYRVRSLGTDEVVLTCREVQLAIDVIDTSGNDKIDAVWTEGKTFNPNVTFLGAYVCKEIAGTSTHSQHSYGNAVDFGAATMAQLQDLADRMVHEADDLCIEHVIVADRIWTRGVGWHAYTGEYHYHVHVDCNPNVDPSRPCGLVQTGKC